MKLELNKIRDVKGLVYLATPYTHSEKAVMEYRFTVANEAAALLIHEGLNIYSPVSHLHNITSTGKFPVDWDFWEENCLYMLSLCEALIVLKQTGWKQSVGLNEEYRFAVDKNMPIGYVTP